ncbi:MAG TPA: hypothetical protein VM934_05480 [Pyrinomonadaceae bacterium]|jgi:hypothetical protein|nr:hypothetical protein [Pyrinomonadaceae bacterium]
MKVPFPRILCVLAGFISCLVISPSLQLSFRETVQAQQNCYNVPYLDAPFWKSGVTVAVIVDANSSFNNTEIEALKRAVQNWNNSKSFNGNNSNVSINETFSISPNPPNSRTASPILYIKKGDTHGFAALTRTDANSVSVPYISIARITIEQSINWLVPYDPTGWSLTSVMAHEIGHTFSLNDCYPACNGISVMGVTKLQ